MRSLLLRSRNDEDQMRYQIGRQIVAIARVFGGGMKLRLGRND